MQRATGGRAEAQYEVVKTLCTVADKVNKIGEKIVKVVHKAVNTLKVKLFKNIPRINKAKGNLRSSWPAGYLAAVKSSQIVHISPTDFLT